MYSQHVEDNKVRTTVCANSVISETPDSGLEIKYLFTTPGRGAQVAFHKDEVVESTTSLPLHTVGTTLEADAVKQ